ncbi:MAG: ATP synthase subunit I [Byssovorax sp.]
MKMNEPLTLVLAWAAGMALGAMFFGGLWWTVRKGVSSPRPALWFLGSMLARTAVALAGFYFVAGGRWERIFLCLLGFLMARFAVTWWTRPSREIEDRAAPEVSHAP